MPPWLVVPVPRKLGKFGKLFTDSSLLQLPAEQLPAVPVQAGPSSFFLNMYIWCRLVHCPAQHLGQQRPRLAEAEDGSGRACLGGELECCSVDHVITCQHKRTGCRPSGPQRDGLGRGWGPGPVVIIATAELHCKAQLRRRLWVSMQSRWLVARRHSGCRRSGSARNPLLGGEPPRQKGPSTSHACAGWVCLSVAMHVWQCMCGNAWWPLRDLPRPAQEL